MSLLPKCEQTKRCPNCKFRGLYDMCLILNNTSFNKQCPFYKTNKFKDTNVNEANSNTSEAPKSRQDA